MNHLLGHCKLDRVLRVLLHGVSRLETDTELTNLGYISTRAESLCKRNHQHPESRIDLNKEELAFVPDLAMVLRLLTMSALVIPIPVSGW
jgi:hypothetical protein